MKYRFECKAGQLTSSMSGIVTGDVAIVAASWERRSKAALEIINNVELRKLIVIRFSNVGRSGISGNIRNEYKDYCRKKNIEYHEVVFESTSPEHEQLVRCSKEVDRVLATARRVILDITSMPRILWSSLVALWDMKDTIRSIVFLYARPKYSFHETPDRKLVFDYTNGDWRLMEPAFRVPVFKGGLKKTNFISIGYEYDHIKKLLYKFEADDNVFFYSNPGFRQEYTKLAIDTITKLKNVFEVPEYKFHPIGVQNFIALHEKLTGHIREVQYNAGNSILLICAGSKIHSLAFLFCALENPDIVMYIRVPKIYKEVSTEWTSEFEIIAAENILAPL